MPFLSAKLSLTCRKCPTLVPKCPLFIGHIVLVSFVFINIPALNANIFCAIPHLSRFAHHPLSVELIMSRIFCWTRAGRTYSPEGNAVKSRVQEHMLSISAYAINVKVSVQDLEATICRGRKAG